MSVSAKPGYIARHRDEVEATPCPCGSATRIITSKDFEPVGFHVTHIMDSRKHYHKKMTEIYYILEGEGFLEVADDTIPVKPGLTVLIEKGTPHRGYGDFKTIIVTNPAFDPTDEYFPDEEPAER